MPSESGYTAVSKPRVSCRGSGSKQNLWTCWNWPVRLCARCVEIILVASESALSVMMASTKTSVSQQLGHTNINLLTSLHIRHFWKALECHIGQWQLSSYFRDTVRQLSILPQTGSGAQSVSPQWHEWSCQDLLCQSVGTCFASMWVVPWCSPSALLEEALVWMAERLTGALSENRVVSLPSTVLVNKQSHW